MNGGYPALADAAVFRREFTLLRHILKAPFDAPPNSAVPGDGSGGEHGASQPRRGTAPGVQLYQHLIDRLSAIEGSCQADQEAVLRKDLEGLLRPYGFAPEVKGRPRPERSDRAGDS